MTVIFAGVVDPTHIIRGVAFREPFFRNRPASYWRELLREDMSDSEIAEETVKQFENKSLAAPVLGECLADENQGVRWAAVSLALKCCYGANLERILQRALDDSDLDVKYLAIRRVGGMREYEVGWAKPKLVQLRGSSEPSIASAADYSLWNIAPDVAGNTEPWQVFTSDEWQFSVTLPGTPEREITTTQGPYGEITSHRFTLQFGICNFGVAVYEIPPEVGEHHSAEDRYDSMAEQKPLSFGGTLKRNEKVTQNGYVGRDIVIEVEKKAIIHDRSFIIGSRGYAIQIVYPSGEAINPKAEEHFFDSFVINYQPDHGEADVPPSAAQ